MILTNIHNVKSIKCKGPKEGKTVYEKFYTVEITIETDTGEELVYTLFSDKIDNLKMIPKEEIK
jgi:hypothetical protein